MNKLLIIGIAILATGLVALPQTFALFAGQHDWYDVNSADGAGGVTGIPCMKCHADVKAQMDAMGANLPHTSSAMGTNPCVTCHVDSQIDKGAITEADIGGSAADKLHAAAAPLCLDCHGDGVGKGFSYSSAPDAVSIFGTTYSANVGSIEVHGNFANNASATGEDVLKGENEACVGCHTHVGVNATWIKPTMLSFRAESSTKGKWTVSNFAADAGYTNITGAPVGVEPYNENSGIDYMNTTNGYIQVN